MRVPFRTLLSIAFAVAALGIAIAYAAARAAAPQRAATPQYNVVFSRDDKLCITMRDFYNRHVRDFDDRKGGYIEEQFANELYGSEVEFTFESKGWRAEPAAIWWNQVLLSLDVYNDGNLRTVVVQDKAINGSFGTFYTVFYILNPDVSPNNVQELIADGFLAIPPPLEQSIYFGWRLGSSLVSTLSGVYQVREVPPSAQRKFGGGMGGQARMRLLRYEGHIYGIARTPLDKPIRPAHDGSSILVFSMSRAGPITDECYLEFQFPRQK